MSEDRKPYVRDKRSPTPKSESVSRVMSANKAKNTKPELALRKELWHQGLKGYRLHCKDIPGKPDICYSSKKVAIFVNGCFWHRCPHCQYDLPKYNTEFWREKFEKNQARDLRKVKALEEQGWKVIVIWECQLKRDIDMVAEDIKPYLNKEQ